MESRNSSGTNQQQRLKLRHEYKFLLNDSQYLELRAILRKVMQKDANSETIGGYHIRSLYFDDVYDRARVEKEEGFCNRKKFRVRIYNFSDKIIKLEVKEKFQDYIQKKASSITKSEYERILKGDVSFLHNQKNETRELYYLHFRNSNLKPKVVVDYYREALVLPFNQIRITFDTGLSAAKPTSNIFSPNIISSQVGKEYGIILEVKYNNFFPAHLRSILQVYCNKPLAVSKYLICRNFSELKR